MSNRISHNRLQRQARGSESGLPCSLLATTTKKAPACLMGDAILSGNLAKGFLMLTDTAHHIGLVFRWEGTVRLMWTWTLLYGDDRRKTTEYLLQRQKSLIEHAMRGNKVNQHW